MYGAHPNVILSICYFIYYVAQMAKIEGIFHIIRLENLAFHCWNGHCKAMEVFFGGDRIAEYL